MIKFRPYICFSSLMKMYEAKATCISVCHLPSYIFHDTVGWWKGRHALLSRGWRKKDKRSLTGWPLNPVELKHYSDRVKLISELWLTSPWRFKSFPYSNWKNLMINCHIFMLLLDFSGTVEGTVLTLFLFTTENKGKGFVKK